jgi:hypothetical protein
MLLNDLERTPAMSFGVDLEPATGGNIVHFARQRERLAVATKNYLTSAVSSGRGQTLLPSTKLTGGLRIT